MFKLAVTFAVLAVSSIAGVSAQGHHQHQYNEAANSGPVWAAPIIAVTETTMDLMGPVMFPSDVLVSSSLDAAAMRGDTSELSVTGGEYVSSTAGSPAAESSAAPAAAAAAAEESAAPAAETSAAPAAEESAEIIADAEPAARFAVSAKSAGLVAKLLAPLKKIVNALRALNASTLIKAGLVAGLVAVLAGVAFAVAAAGVASVGGLVSAVTGFCGIIPYVDASMGGSAYLLSVIRGKMQNHLQY